jgi:hypothetical protein
MLFLGTGVAWAQSAPPPHAPPPHRDPPAQQRDHGNGLPDSVRRVERQTGGEVLRAEPMQRDGREVYRLKVLTADGRVRVVQDDPDQPPPSQRPSGSKSKGKSKGNDNSSRDSDEQPPQ